MKSYELNYLITPNLTETEVKNFHEKINSLIQEKGVLINAWLPKKIALSYPIKENNSAFFVALSFQIEPGNLAELEKNLKSESRLIRYLILTKRATKPTVFKTKIHTAKKIKPSEKEKVKIEKIEEKLEEVLGEDKKYAQ